MNCITNSPCTSGTLVVWSSKQLWSSQVSVNNFDDNVVCSKVTDWCTRLERYTWSFSNPHRYPFGITFNGVMLASLPTGRSKGFEEGIVRASHFGGSMIPYHIFIRANRDSWQSGFCHFQRFSVSSRNFGIMKVRPWSRKVIQDSGSWVCVASQLLSGCNLEAWWLILTADYHGLSKSVCLTY